MPEPTQDVHIRRLDEDHKPSRKKQSAENLSRRIALGGLAAAAISTQLIKGQQPPAGAPDGPVDFTYSPELNDPEVFKFISDPARTSPYAAPIPPQPGFDRGQRRLADKKSKMPSSTPGMPDVPITLSGAVREYYTVRQRNAIVGSFSVVVPITQPVEIEVYANLFVRSGLPASVRQRIESAFSAYSQGDPNQFARQQMGNDVTADMFRIVPSFELTKQPSRVPHTEQLNAVLSTYENVTPPSQGIVVNLDILGREAPLKTHFAREYISATHIKTEILDTFPPSIVDSQHVREVNPDDPVGTLADILTADKDRVDCNLDPNPLSVRIATVLAFPEFKLTWEPRSIRIGCFTVILHLPILYVRVGREVLYAYVGHVRNPDQLLIKQVEDCAINAALAGAVIGIVLANFAAALAGFQAVFTNCLQFKGLFVAGCFVPGLSLLTEHTNWKPLY
jgi:hypothetical protein